MISRRASVTAVVAAVLVVPAGAAFAQARTPSPSPMTGTSTSRPGGYGPGTGPSWMTGGYGDVAVCPLHGSPEAQQWRAERDHRQRLSPQERQQLIEQHRALMHRKMAAATTR
jgi:hypothetical protein